MNSKATQSILALATASLKSGQNPATRSSIYPRVDYIELQQIIDMDVLNYSIYEQNRFGGLLRRVETNIRSDLYLTLIGLLHKRSHRLVFTMSERAGIPFAFLQQYFPGRKPLVSMFTSWSWRQEKAITSFNLFSAMDLIIVKCQAMQQNFLSLKAPPERIRVIPFGIDHHFFSPIKDVEQLNNFVMTTGEIRTRDYATLFKAVAELPIKIFAAATGSWYAREKHTSLEMPVPDNVILSHRLSPAELRTAYAQSSFVVVPLYDAPHSAGATTVLEAMSMGRAVIVSRSSGILDYVIDGQTGILVSPGNVEEMREVIAHLISHPEEARRLGQNARRRIEAELNIDVYVKQIADTLKEYISRL
ncbi:MAG: glycosyltransferase family 4 protein [Chloroflexota bacterium]